jgi:hypothetical protein
MREYPNRLRLAWGFVHHLDERRQHETAVCRQARRLAKLKQALEGKVIEEAELMGTYAKGDGKTHEKPGYRG